MPGGWGPSPPQDADSYDAPAVRRSCTLPPPRPSGLRAGTEEAVLPSPQAKYTVTLARRARRASLAQDTEPNALQGLLEEVAPQARSEAPVKTCA